MNNGFDAIYRAHIGYVLHSVRRLGIELRDIEDVAHDVLLVAARKFADYDRARPLRPWLFGIAFRVALDYRRSSRKVMEQLDAAEDTADDRATADAGVERREKQRLVLSALATLTLEQRAVFVLHDIDETPIPEIAAVLEIPVNTAYSRLRLARNQFAFAVRELVRENR